MRILCCRLGFCSVILRATIYHVLKLTSSNFLPLISFSNNKVKSHFSKEELKALHNLRKQKHLVIQKADKGNTVVITEKNVLINKMKEIISDASKSEQISIVEDKH